MNSTGELDSIFDFFELVISYYRYRKNTHKLNLKIPSQLDIGSLFGGLGSNYSKYKKEKKIPNIWDKDVSEEYIVEDIYNKLYTHGIIPQDQTVTVDFIDYLYDLIIKFYKEKIHIQGIKEFIDDLTSYKYSRSYKKYLKSIIEFSNKKDNMVYHSKLKDSSSIDKNHTKLSTVNKKDLLYTKYLKEKIKKDDWISKYSELTNLTDFNSKLDSLKILKLDTNYNNLQKKIITNLNIHTKYILYVENNTSNITDYNIYEWTENDTNILENIFLTCKNECTEDYLFLINKEDTSPEFIPFTIFKENFHGEGFLYYIFEGYKIEDKVIYSDENIQNIQTYSPNYKSTENSIFNIFFYSIVSNEDNLSNRISDKKEKSYYYFSQKAIIKNNLRYYIQRKNLDEKFEDFLSRNKNGVFWLESIPGQGKSCWLSWIINKYSAVHHFINYSERRNSISNMIRSLISQLNDKFKNHFGDISENENQLYNHFSNLIFDVSLKLKEPLIICIDAVDELENINNVHKLDFLPDNLPDNIYFVFTSRHLIKFNYPNNVIKVDLEPFDIDDIELVNKYLGYSTKLDDLQKFYRISNGNPMIIKWCFDLCKTNDFNIKNSLTNLESVLDETFNNIYSKDEEHIINILSILTISKVGLSVSFLSDLLDLNKVLVINIIKKQLRSILKLEGTKISIMHRVVFDYLMDDNNDYSLGRKALLKAHNLMTLSKFDIDNERKETYDYFVNFSFYHYFYLKKYDDIVSKLMYNTDLNSQIISLFVSELQKKETTNYLILLEKMFQSNTNGNFNELLKQILEILLEYGCLNEIDLAKKYLNNFDENYYKFILLKKERVLGNVQNVLSIGKSLIKENLNDLFKCEVFFMLGEGFREKGEHDNSFNMYNNALEYPGIEDNYIMYTNIKLQIADITYVYGDLIQSENILYELLKFIQKNSLLSIEGCVYRSLGQLEHVRKNYEKAVEFYNNALEINIKLNQYLRLSEINNSLAEVVLYLDNEKASEYIDIGRKYSNQCNSKIELGKSFYIEAHNLYKIGDYPKAEISAKKGMKILTEVGYGSGIARVNLITSIIKFKQQKFKEALYLACEAIKYYKSENIYPSHRYKALKIALKAEEKLGLSIEVSKIDCLENIPYKENFHF